MERTKNPGSYNSFITENRLSADDPGVEQRYDGLLADYQDKLAASRGVIPDELHMLFSIAEASE